ncbi:putative sodium-coupled neutral amino acid transporter 8 [Thunnus maccoyii]|uniref:putative sodium-coupled neutral amino acid transporter 8 n=1 Tax=Thunnus maccoyii TaxID=8240 RepID=UPI001C4DA1ED|nr:putative sodium-coupled neutral amino acid transporter 8 [Thunnus maccoyii]XP_042267754.1 putative sodium-coupled neutral amino acid transporter 8 [Thunnus maccoyii]
MEELARESISLLARSASHADPPRLGSFGAVFIMLKSALGAGLLNFPWAFQKAGGVKTAITVELVSLVFLISGLVILGYASSVSRQKTYQDVVREVCGRAVGQLCEVCFCFNLFMICVAFLVVVQDQLEKLCISLYETVTGSSEGEMPYHWYTDQRFALFIMCLIIILPLSIPKEIGIQKYTSVLGTLAATYLCVAVIVKYYLMESHTAIITPEHSQGVSSWASMFSVVPTICFGFQCHEACIAIYSSMENQKLSHWVVISVVSMFFCLLIYTLTGVYGFMTFGRDVASDILMSYPGNDVVMIISRLLFGISIITIYPIILLLGRSVILNLMLRVQRRRWGIVTHSFESRCRVVLTVIWITITLLIAMFVPDMGEVISVIGGISAFFIFIFPGLCLVFTMQTETVTPRVRVILTVWGIITVVVGAFIFGQSTTIAIMELLHKF